MVIPQKLSYKNGIRTVTDDEWRLSSRTNFKVARTPYIKSPRQTTDKFIKKEKLYQCQQNIPS